MCEVMLRFGNVQCYDPAAEDCVSAAGGCMSAARGSLRQRTDVMLDDASCGVAQSVGR